MKCPYCQEEIGDAGFGYCPYCGKKLEAGKKEERGLFTWGVVVWPLLSWVVLSSICFWVDIVDGTRAFGDAPLVWFPYAWLAISATIPYIVGIWIIYHHAKRHKRNAVAWATASIAFSPVLAGIAYGLTWPKSQQ